MMKEIYKVFRDLKLILIFIPVLFVCLAFLGALWLRHSWIEFDKSMEERSAAFSAEMEADFQARMAEQRKKTAQIKADLQARTAEQRKKTAEMEAAFQARMAEQSQRAARLEAKERKKAARQVGK